MVAMYLDFGLGASPDELDSITSCQVGQETVLLRQESPWRVGTQIELACFLPGVVTIAVIVAGFIGAAVASHVALVPKNRSDYAVGLTLTEIARFARADIGDIKGKLLFLTLHAEFPRLTVGGVAGNSGIWSADAVLGAEVVQ